MPVDPHSNEVRYSLALAGKALRDAKPGRVRIASHSSELVKACVRVLAADRYTLIVETPALRLEMEEWFGRPVEVADHGRPAEAALFPFSLEEGMAPADEATVVAVCYNALSYKGVLRRCAGRGVIFGKKAKLERTHDVRVVGALFSPLFVVRLGLAKLVERFDSSLYFRLEDLAMSRLINFGATWRVSYVVVLAGRRAD